MVSGGAPRGNVLSGCRVRLHPNTLFSGLSERGDRCVLLSWCRACQMVRTDPQTPHSRFLNTAVGVPLVWRKVQEPYGGLSYSWRARLPQAPTQRR